MLYLITSVTASSALGLFALWFLRSKNELDARIRSLGDQERMVVERQQPFSQRVAFPFVDGLAKRLMAVLPTSLIRRSTKWLTVAGDKMSPSQFFSIVLIASTLIPAAYFVLVWMATAGSPTVLALLPIPGLAVVGLFFPLMMLRRVARTRQKHIWRSLPNALDLMTTCVEAGLSLDFALQRVSERYKGPLADEIQRMLREMALGKARRDALLGMAERVDLPDLMTFVNSIIQSEAMGTSVGQVLRAQAADMRRRRRQRAEQIARQAPVKMVFPTVFFLMPSLFIVTIGPMMLNIFYELK